MTDPSHAPDPELRARLERESAGLTYGSEADHPFEFFVLPGAGDRPPGADAFARLIGAPDDAPREERDPFSFFAHHAETSDPLDARSQALRPRYEALRDTLVNALRWTTVYRVGRVEVQCYVVGGDGRGNLTGLKTIAVET
ncbi:nuclease A inhibitor family protein [Longimicrobium sp.]|uniref:nuclease A inhibitor family protein n=1 Tax=Longimicrobium sp. TaxID=2029185 RepID=UPI002E310785|nr:nuclease A inhibitor family protein [Longimicrobium sp.]HEX6042756.1 nuclease A inhibitor family protein [Longimicrobium sp.]